MDTIEFLETMSKMTFQSLTFSVGTLKYPKFEIFLTGLEVDHVTHELKEFQGRHTVINIQKTSKSELVRACLSLVLSWVEHEAREEFTYKGRAVFDPHFDVDQIWENSREYEG